jgi:hypothetical protein
MKNDKVRIEFTHQEQVANVTLNAPKANVLDCAMMGICARLSALSNTGKTSSWCWSAEKDRTSVLAPALRNTCRTALPIPCSG